jgi:Zn-dependent M16 (insulinase) family peptidase
MNVRARHLISILVGLIVLAAPARSQTGYDALTQGSRHHGFRTVSVYLNDADEPMGARFVHERTGFTFDSLQIESVPQSFVWVNTFPTSDMGEPHTQEHLLLGKGNVGRSVAGLEQMSITQSSAFTLQWRTCYHAHTASSPDVYFRVLERQLHALLKPDYTDEEIRREVRNFGVTEDSDGSLRLEEKGTVYNEMVSTSDNPWSRLFRGVGHLQYGTSHPLSYNSGGWPAAIREMRAEDIRKFHADTHHLANMGMLGSYPTEMTLPDILQGMDGMLARLQGEDETRRGNTEADLPPPAMAEPGTVRIVEYPHENDQQPGNLVLAWPPARNLPRTDKLLLDLFMSNFAGDPTTNLYKIFIDSQTREMELDARGVFGWTDDDQGQPVYVGLSDVATANLNEATIDEIRARVVKELETIASQPGGSAVLKEFNDRLESRVVESRRDLSKFVNSPPGFGFRGSGPGWMWHLHRLAGQDQFRVSVTMKPELAVVEKLLASNENIWRERLAQWRITGTVPYAVAVRPSSALLAKDREARQARVKAEVKRLQTQYRVDDADEAIRLYKRDYDATSTRLEELAKKSTLPSLVDSPPMTRDDQLDYEVRDRNGVPVVVTTFSNMTAATAGIAIRLDGVAERDLAYLSILPTLLREVGVIRDGKPVSFDEMSEALKNEILELRSYFDVNHETDRCELTVRGSGNDREEARRAVDWMKLILNHPDWRPDNLPRIRDVVDQQLGGLRNRMQAPEEAWVMDPANAYRRQDNPHLLATASFLTRAHNAHRLRWLLKEAGADGDATVQFLTRLESVPEGSSREEVEALLAHLRGDAASESESEPPPKLASVRDAYGRLGEGARSLVDEAVKDLSQVLVGIPDDSFAGDWSYVCRQMRTDLSVPPAVALGELDRVRKTILQRANARMFLVGSRDSQTALDEKISGLLAGFADGSSAPRNAPPSQRAPVTARLRARQPDAKSPLFVGLVAPNMKGGVFIHNVPGTSYHDSDVDSLLDYLSSRIYGGYGPHGIFMKTWGAGLAYSNGFRASLARGANGYYAERTPELPQTLRFVIDYVRDTPRDPGLADYVLAQVFDDFRSASGYERRAEAMAADLADGLTSGVVRRFRQAALAVRPRPNLIDELYERMPNVYGKVLPGYGVKSKEVEDASYFVIGPQRQLDLYADYLQSAEGKEARLFRLYPRDFWMTAEQ